MRNKTSDFSDTKHKAEKESNPSYSMFMIFVIIALITLFTIMYISLYVQISNKNFQIERLKEQKQMVENEHSQIKLEISKLRSISRVERIAINELGMTRAEQVEYIVLGKQENEEIKIDANDVELENKNLFVEFFTWLKNITIVEAGDID